MENTPDLEPEKRYSVVQQTAIWMLGTIVLLVIIGVVKGKNPFQSLGFAIGTAVVAAIPFLIFDRFDNKVAARVLYLGSLAAIIYFWYLT
jgi:NADH:ubiquinone oxidoreductase subunit 6 (subunit J)